MAGWLAGKLKRTVGAGGYGQSRKGSVGVAGPTPKGKLFLGSEAVGHGDNYPDSRQLDKYLARHAFILVHP